MYKRQVLKRLAARTISLYRGKCAMFLCDMHIHSKYSYDGCDTPDDICRAAIARGMRTIAFTDHHDLLPEGMEVSTYEQHDMEARHEIERVRERYAPKLEVLYGIELGEPNTNRCV